MATTGTDYKASPGVLSAQDIARLFESMKRAGTCKVTLRNGTPPSWNVTIVEAGVKFFFRDNTDFVDGPVNLNLSAGQEAYFDSNNPEKCVFQEQTFLKIVVPNQPPAILQAVYTAKPGECLLAITHTLAPKQSIAEKDLPSASLGDLFDLRME